MYELRVAASLYAVEKAYRRPLLRRKADAIEPGETERIWGRKSFWDIRRDN